MATADTAPLQHPARVAPELRQVVAHLFARYPRIAILSAGFRTLDDGPRQQEVRYSASIVRLLEAGLLTPETAEASRDGRRTPQTTPAGCGYSQAAERLHDSRLPGCADLSIYTGEQPRERERFGVKDAVRELHRFMLPRRRGRMVNADMARKADGAAQGST